MRAAGSVISLILPIALAEPALAGPEASGPAPSCVAMYESWRYTDAANNCADALGVLVVYRDGAMGLCYPLPPGASRTVGEGYFGLHGHADHLAVCEAS
ncbi:alpha-amylase [Streptomyces sp. 5-8]|uniref:Alpha-amylase n=1 Tax=Streptomyces musisoli TaxID=2802280 RepID=A0ABS1NW63_9ACTN|nr:MULTISPECIES: alpha-amylase [Streptomyces]MBL1104352.1 alpha-amylase [Streptomyces musisoli]MBY8840324.1 alpha-amylase [Streptomyces sp. SP2-10]